MIRLLSAHVLRLAMLLVCSSWLFPAVRAQAASVELHCATDGVEAGSDFEVEVVIDTGPKVLGAYTVAINYDPAVFSVTGIAGGGTDPFSMLPTVNPGDFPTGRTRISAFNTASLTEPTGTVSVADVGVSVLSAVDGPASIEVEVVTLADIDGARIEEVTTEPCTVSFANRTPQTTFTEVVASPTPSLVPTSTPPPATPTATLPNTEASTATPTATNSITATPTEITCPGDCNSDETVTADELVLGVSIALKRLPVDECRSLDWIADREISVDELVMAVDMALHGCVGVRPFPTETSGASPTPHSEAAGLRSGNEFGKLESSESYARSGAAATNGDHSAQGL